MQLMQFFITLDRSDKPTVDGESVVHFNWEDEDDDTQAIRVTTTSRDILIYATDRIVKESDRVVVSIGAKDHIFKFV